MSNEAHPIKGATLTARHPSIFRALTEIMLRREKQRFSPVFYEMHCRRTCDTVRSQSIWLCLACVIAGIACVPIWSGRGDAYAAAFAAALFVFVLLGTVLGTRDAFEARILPYFERRLKGTDTWMAGKALLRNSAALDQIAVRLAVIPLSVFASGDPLINCEETALFDAAHALTTAEALLQSDAASALGADVIADLTKLRDALTIARDNGVRVALHLREGSSASGAEMDRRQGSYF